MLHCDEDSDVVFSHSCVTIIEEWSEVEWSKGKSTVNRSYKNWQDALKKHEGSDCHKSSIDTLPAENEILLSFVMWKVSYVATELIS